MTVHARRSDQLYYLLIVKEVAVDQVLDFVSNTLALGIPYYIKQKICETRPHLSLCFLLPIIITITAKLVPPIVATVPMQIKNSWNQSIISVVDIYSRLALFPNSFV